MIVKKNYMKQRHFQLFNLFQRMMRSDGCGELFYQMFNDTLFDGDLRKSWGRRHGDKGLNILTTQKTFAQFNSLAKSSGNGKRRYII